MPGTRAFHMVSKCSPTQLHPQLLSMASIIFLRNQIFRYSLITQLADSCDFITVKPDFKVTTEIFFFKVFYCVLRVYCGFIVVEVCLETIPLTDKSPSQCRVHRGFPGITLTANKGTLEPFKDQKQGTSRTLVLNLLKGPMR